MTQPKQGRLLSLDAFRGFTIACMILVNFPGTWDHVYAPLLHVEWNGLTPTDLIFPSFIFMVGVSIVFAFQKRKDSGVPVGSLATKVVLRALKIYVVGMFLFLLFPLWDLLLGDGKSIAISDIRFTGVLHRIALVFLVCGLLFLYTKWKTQLIICLLFLFGYWGCMMFIPTPGQDGKVMFEPGNNLATWVDGYLLPGRPWWGPWNHERPWDEAMTPWDPEGALSTFPSICSGIIGMFAGMLLLSRKSQERKVMILYLAGALMMGLSYFWDQVFPINKSMWTSSYVLFSSGFACTVLASFLYLVDILGYKRWVWIGLVFGCNAIAVYCLADILYPFYAAWLNEPMMEKLISAGTSANFASMVSAITFVAINFIPAWILYKCKIYIRL